MEEDNRFKHISSDPKFRHVPKKERKVKIDKRFQSMFEDSRFKFKTSVDKRGRPVGFESSENYRKYYDLSSEEEEEEDDEDEQEKKEKKSNKIEEKSNSEDEESNDDDELLPEKADDVEVSGKIKEKLKDLTVDYARGGACIMSDDSSSSDDDDTDEQDDDNEVDHNWGELDHDAEVTEEATSRIAVCNMDWDRVNSEDLMVLLSSFLPSGGVILKVTVYPSEFGLEQMKEEEIKGPKELSEQKEDDTTGEDNFDIEKLRKYEIRRLKYYYAVVECDTVKTANHIYNECDGLEYESSAAKLDLRFIPDDTTFDHEARDECNKLPDQNKYRPQFFKASALTQAKFELSWDKTDPRRVELSHRVWANKDKDNLDDDDLKAVLASSSSEEEDEEEPGKSSKNKYRALLDGLDDGNNKDEELEVTWEVGLEAKTEEKLKESAGLTPQTPFEKMMAKKREKIKARRLEKKQKILENSEDEIEAFSDDELPEELSHIKDEILGKNKKKQKKQGKSSLNTNETDAKQRAELELLLMDEKEDESKHFNFDTRRTKSIKKKREIEEQQDDFKVNIQDPRFSALYKSHLYNLDPADPHYKSTPATQAFIQEKLRRRNDEDELEIPKKKTKKGKKQDPELSLLVKNIKRKTEQNFGVKKKKIKS